MADLRAQKIVKKLAVVHKSLSQKLEDMKMKKQNTEET